MTKARLRPAKTWALREARKPKLTSSRLYTLAVSILSGNLNEEFGKANPELIRVIQIRGDQTLEDLHHAIFKAFDRFDEHFYEFQFGKGPMRPENDRYVLRASLDAWSPDDVVKKSAGLVDETTMDSLGLKKDQVFGYWFDFGDDWWHQIDVEAIDAEIPKGRYPRLIRKVGKSPPQYPPLEDED